MAATSSLGPDAATAERFLGELEQHRSEDELRKVRRYFKSGAGEYGEGDVFIGVRMATVFDLAKRFVEMAPPEIEKLLESEVHEARAGACSVMAKQAARKQTSDARREELFELYLRRIDRINNWDLVDLAAREVIGRWLADKPRDPLDELARADDVWSRRTAMYATSYFIRRGDLDDTFRIAELLLEDDEELVQKAVGGWLREAGKHDRDRLLRFLDEHAARMPRLALRHAIEHLDADLRAYYRALEEAPEASSPGAG